MKRCKETIMFTILLVIVIMSVSAFGGTIQLPQTGQTKCYDSLGYQIDCAGTGQDGEIKAGVAWPNPRFTDNGNYTVTDNLTGLIWVINANPQGPPPCEFGMYMTWQSALDYIKCLNDNSVLGYTGWRLPNRKDLRSLIDYSNYDDALPTGHPFDDVRKDSYWSSTSFIEFPYKAWTILLTDGRVDTNQTKDWKFFYVWPVRGGLLEYTLYMAVKGATNNNIYIRYMDNTGTWTAWTIIPGQTTVSPALVVFNNRLYLFVKGATNNNIYYRSMDTLGTWSSWLTVPGGITSDTPALNTYCFSP